jgi:hypothetical protein
MPDPPPVTSAALPLTTSARNGDSIASSAQISRAPATASRFRRPRAGADGEAPNEYLAVGWWFVWVREDWRRTAEAEVSRWLLWLPAAGSVHLVYNGKVIFTSRA